MHILGLIERVISRLSPAQRRAIHAAWDRAARRHAGEVVPDAPQEELELLASIEPVMAAPSPRRSKKAS